MRYLLLLLLVGCNSTSFSEKNADNYQIYAEDFKADLAALGYNVQFSNPFLVYSGRVAGDSLGECPIIARAPKGQVVIRLHTSLDYRREWVKKAVIYHLIGHCYFGLKDGGMGIMQAGDLEFKLTEAHMTDSNMRLQLVSELF